MSPNRINLTPPTWEELRVAIHPDAPAALREELKQRLMATTPTDEAVLGARDFLEDNHYDFDALRSFVEPSPESNKRQGLRSAKTTIFRFASAAILLLLLTYSGIQFQASKRHQRMTSTIFYEPGLPVFAGLGGDRTFHEMMSAFRLEEAEAGLQFIDTLEKRYGQNDTLAYYAGWLHYFDRNYTSAYHRFDAVTRFNASIYLEKAMLMCAASACLAGRREEALTLVNRILATPTHPFRKTALAIKEDPDWWN